METMTMTVGKEVAGTIIQALTYSLDGLADDLRDKIAEVAQLRDELAKAKDNPDADCTDYAHPAWWRGHDHTVSVMCQKINDIIDGRDGIHGVASEPWESTRLKMLGLKQRAERAEIALKEEQSKFLAKCTEANRNLRNERDEALAKLESRMVMRDGQLWEAISQSIHDKLPAPAGQWQFFGTLDTEETIYRRPITPSELQGWIEPQGEVLLEPGWLARQLQEVQEEVAKWPDIVKQLGSINAELVRKAGE